MINYIVFMKKLIIITILLMSLNSCYDRIKIDRHKITLDGDAQEVVIKANTGIFSIYVDCDERVQYDNINTIYTTTAKGSWFEITVDENASRRKAKVVVSKNDSGDKRKIRVSFSESKYDAYCTIIQNPL